MRRLKWIALALAACLLAGAALYLSDGYPASDTALSSGEGIKDLRVSLVDRVWRFQGSRPRAALVFYPGGKVDAPAYAPLLSQLALSGVDCFMPEMPFRLALLNGNAAAAIMRQHDYPRWYVGGHSLGGAAAAMFASDHPEGLDGLILLAAYPTKPLPEGLRLLSIRGSRDGVLNLKNYEDCRGNWPPDAAELVIEGGNHSGFGDYGAQRGDRNPDISPEEQRRQASEAIAAFCGAQDIEEEDEAMPREIGHLPMNESLRGQAELIQNVKYSKNGQTLTLILPWAPGDDRRRLDPMPLVVFVQGSAWQTPNLNYEIPMLSHLAEAGMVVATVSHRNAMGGHPFPAFLEDVKCAIRFLRANAAAYAIDPERVAAFGTSSGGNTVCLLGLTGDDPAYKTDEYPDESDAVCGVVACFAPTDLETLFGPAAYASLSGMVTAFFGGDRETWPERMREFSPVYRVEDGREYPPFLLLHGTGDRTVPHSQTEALYDRLTRAGVDARAYLVDGAEHEGNFWGPEVREIIADTLAGWLLPRA